MVDDEIREALLEEAERVAIPDGAWQRLESCIAEPAPPPASLRLVPRPAEPTLTHPTPAAGRPVPVDARNSRRRSWRSPLRPLEWLAAGALLLVLAGIFTLRYWGGRGSAEPRVPVVITPPRTLTVEEHPLVEQSVDTPTHFNFRTRVSKDVLDLRRAWREVPSPLAPNNLAAANAALIPFAYRLEKGGTPDHPTYNLYQGMKLLLTGITRFDPPSVNSHKTQFALVVRLETEDGAEREFLVSAGALAAWDSRVHLGQPPVYAGEDLITVQGVGDGLRDFWLLSGSRVVYTAPMGRWIAVVPLRRLDTWDGTWLVEVSGEVIIGGHSLNQQLGYDEIFGWRLVDGKPFFFYRKGDRYGISWGGTPLEQTWDVIVHDQCCAPGMYNPEGNGTMVWFWARKGEMWYYVEAGVYQ